MTANLSREQMNAWRLFLEAHASLMRILERELVEERRLPLNWYDLLVQLEEAGGRLRMSELARRLLLSRSTTTRFVERLERTGLIERRACPEDRRGTNVVLTSVGLETLRAAAPVHLAGIQKHFVGPLSDADTKALIEVLSKVLSRSRSDDPNLDRAGIATGGGVDIEAEHPARRR